jgi:hypothetical protein
MRYGQINTGVLFGTQVGVYRYPWTPNLLGIEGDKGGFVFVWQMYGGRNFTNISRIRVRISMCSGEHVEWLNTTVSVPPYTSQNVPHDQDEECILYYLGHSGKLFL